MATHFRRVFFAYPSGPADLVRTIDAATKIVESNFPKLGLTTWPQINVFGANIPDEVRQAILECDVIVCDVTFPNRNVYYEIGYAIGLGKPIAPILNVSFSDAVEQIQKDGIFDNIGYRKYENFQELTKCFSDLPDVKLIELYAKPINHSQPLFVLDAFRKTDFRNAIISAVKDSRVFYRSFDPVENPRFSAVPVISDVTASAGLIIPVLGPHIDDAIRHNLRGAFLAGLRHGLGRETLLLQFFTDDESGPTDYQNNIIGFKSEEDIADAIAEFSSNAIKSSQSLGSEISAGPKSALQKLTLGASAAENEFRSLQTYFVETSEYLRAVRGEVRIIAGRKGSGKTAIFFQVRDHFRKEKGAVITDLKPESHQLSLFRSELLKAVDVGTYDHTLAAFWYFLILSEIVLQLHQKFEHEAQINQKSLEGLREIESVLEQFRIIQKGDFTTRINRLSTYILQEIKQMKAKGKKISAEHLTNIIFREGVAQLRKLIEKYTERECLLVFLFDNIDKSWPSSGVDQFDIRTVRLLVEVLDKTRQDFEAEGWQFMSILFLRNDIYELLVDETPDRGKAGELRIDWTDRTKLRQVIYKRLQASVGDTKENSFEALWDRFFVAEVEGLESFEYLVNHCLMRPRFLLNIIENAISHGINRQHERVEAEDCIDAVKQHSNYLVSDFGYEIRDVSGLSEDILYAFIGVTQILTKGEIFECLHKFGVENGSLEEAYRLLLWYGVIGIGSQNGEEKFIYDYEYNLKRVEAEIARFNGEALYVVNSAFHVALKG